MNDGLSQMGLSERKKLILKAIVEAHIELGEPVGSKTLMQNRQFNISSATIRNEMAELEELGYLEQPHTSAGRIPSESGYRFYVDSLAARYRMTAREINELHGILRTKVLELDSILASAAKIASRLTNYTALSVKQKQSRLVVIRFECIPLDRRGFIIVMVTESGAVKTKHVTLGADITPEETTLLSRTLNECVAGVPLEQITLPVMLEMEKRMGSAANLISPIIKCIYEACSESGTGELKIEGINRLLQYPDYYDIDRVRGLLTMFENGDDIVNVLSGENGDALRVFIGSENKVKVMDNSTLIYRTVVHGGHVVGAVGVIGPCRMDYPRVMAMIDSLSENIGKALDGSAPVLPDGETHDI